MKYLLLAFNALLLGAIVFLMADWKSKPEPKWEYAIFHDVLTDSGEIAYLAINNTDLIGEGKLPVSELAIKVGSKQNGSLDAKYGIFNKLGTDRWELVSCGVLYRDYSCTFKRQMIAKQKS